MIKTKKPFLFILITIIFVLNFTISLADNDHNIINKETHEKINEFKNEINNISNVIIAFAAITSVLIFIIHFIRLAAHANKPTFRSLVMRDIMITGICTALIGAISILVKIYINIFT